MSTKALTVLLIALSFVVAAAADERDAAAEENARLIEMARKGIFSEAGYALESGADPNFRYESGTTPLLEAVIGRYYPVVQLLLESRGDPNVRDKRNNPVITFAARQGDLDVIQALIRAGADVDARDTDGIEQLSNQSGVTALWITARWGMIDAARALLEAGADPNTKDADGVPAWNVAKAYEHKEIYQMLLDAGAEGPHPEPSGRPEIGK